MKKQLTTIFAFLLTLCLWAQDGKYTAEASASKFNWRGEKVTGYHEGTIAVKSGSFEVKDGLIKSGTFVIDMTTINCTDLSGETKGKLEGHLHSADFFGTEKHKEAKLVIKNSSKQGNELKVRGEITIKGVTKPVEFRATLSPDGNKMIAKGKLVVDRTDFNVKYGSGSFFDSLGDNMIYDNFDLDFNVVAKK